MRASSSGQLLITPLSLPGNDLRAGSIPDFLRDRPDFNELLMIVANQRGIDPVRVGKDYWIMHCLWGLQARQICADFR